MYNKAGGMRIPEYSNQESMILAQKQKYRSMEQNRKHKNKLMHI